MTGSDESATFAPPGLDALVARLIPGGRILRVDPLGPTPKQRQGEKARGYGRPLRIDAVDGDGQPRKLVFRVALPNEFGHDRRADRAEAAVLAFDSFGRVNCHVPALDVGAVGDDGSLISVAHGGEFYLVTGYAEGTLYADDLRRIASAGGLTALDTARCESMARYLGSLHQERIDDPVVYRRAVRDLVGHGEGIFGIIDGYPLDTPVAHEERLHELEKWCVEWRWRLRTRHHRLRRIHGDFHPFNVVFTGGADFALLDTSRGSAGDPADDLTAMAVNFVFFAIEHPDAWRSALSHLWDRFWEVYLEETGDRELLEVVPPFLAWRLLVVSNPQFYPALSATGRDLLLRFAERALSAPRFDPAMAQELFR